MLMLLDTGWLKITAEAYCYLTTYNLSPNDATGVLNFAAGHDANFLENEIGVN